MDQDICHFIPFQQDLHSIHTVSFILETKPQQCDHLRTESVYKMYYVRTGKGHLHTQGRITPIKQGDIFFTFPANSFAIESDEHLTYMYISFIGVRGNMLLDNLSINRHNFLFSNCNEVQDFWDKGINSNPNIINTMSESVLLYTFSFLGNRLLPRENESKQQHSVGLIKKYIDDHFTDQDFSLENASAQLSYNKKYISYAFKKHFGVGVIEYLNTIRIQNACTMIEQGFTSVTDIADRCGYSDAQYFSKIFKEKIGIVPTKYIKSVKNRQ